MTVTDLPVTMKVALVAEEDYGRKKLPYTVGAEEASGEDNSESETEKVR